jgi:DNA processing protein
VIEDWSDRLRLARTEGIGPVLYRRLLRRFGTAAAALDALPELARAGGRRQGPRSPSPAQAERERERVEEAGATLLFLGGSCYPALLALLDDAPPVFSVLGDPGILDRRAVAIVGGRNASANARRHAEALAADLAATGLVVVSGMARGVDAAAHAGALATGTTVACIAGGVDVAYPPENADLQRRVAEMGAVVAEAPPGTAPRAQHFPRRNRLIAGLSLGVVVIEAAMRSGSLITARLAAENNRELFAAPGSPLDERSRGSNNLLRQGAHLVETAADVFANLPDHPLREGLARLPVFARGEPPRPVAPAADPAPEHSHAELAQARSRVLPLLSPAPTPVDDLVRRCHLPVSAVLAVLLELELAGRAEVLPGQHVVLTSEALAR